ncbi:methyltransferase-like protein 22 isoform X2 [Salarias fasciatus]|uniref:methyltransferase-like protein 22 isoform X2 n=1 Tax=Salarias fasciatus TaxID=181472 RepID=UPI001176EEB3|nr:methyltransferase-like protein 22 isoform X2 [Salarias fasciatus]
MDQMTFHYDTVLSDVHMHRPSSRHLMTRLNHMGQPVFVSRFRILTGRAAEHKAGSGSDGEEEEEEEEQDGTVQLDEDGDFEVTHRPRRTSVAGEDRELVCPVILKQSDPEPEPEPEPEPDQEEKEKEDEEEEEKEEKEEEARCSRDVITIEHTMATPLEDVGKQVWRGAFLLADFILSEPQSFRGATVLELGGGTGFTSVVMATVAKTVYCTDVGDDLLSMCERNVALNRHLLEPKDADTEFSWSEEEVSDLHDNTTFIIAADVCYDDDLTDAFFRTLYKLCSNFSRPCAVLISIEKRMNFTLRHLDVTCEAYSHFRACLEQLQALQDGRCSFRVEPLTSNFPQFLLYERIEHLELWKVTSTPLPAGLQEDSGS